MKLTDLRKKTEKELLELVKTTKTDIEKANKTLINGKEKNLKKPRQFKKDVARILTVINEQKFMKETK